MFTRLEFHDFRGFAHLDLPGLQRVNLICGQNNSGKTSLLEGIVVLSDPSRLARDLPGLLRAAPVTAEHYQRWVVRDGAPKESLLRGWRGEASITRRVAPAGKELLISAPGRSLPVSSDHLCWTTEGASPVSLCRVVSVQFRSRASLVECFGKAVRRRGGEERLEKMLREIDPRLRSVRLQAAKDTVFLEVDLGLSQRLPLEQAGQGLSRLVAMYSEILGEAPDVCLIDEIENGIHHTVLSDLWRGIAVAAQESGVQIFATTHSRECIESAHEVFSARDSYDLSVIQLFRNRDDRLLPTQARVLDRRLIDAAVSGRIDLR